MAKFNFVGSDSAKRGEVWSVDPTTIIVDQSKNGRYCAPDNDKVNSLAASIETHGQLQPISCRKNASKELEIVTGYTRLRAVLKLHAKNADMKIRVQLVELNDVDSFLHNIAENLERNDLSPIDHAYNIRRLERDYGKSRKDVAEVYQWSVSKIAQYVSLLTLGADLQAQIGEGKLPLAAALALVGVDESDATAIVATSTKKNKVNGQVKVRANVVAQAAASAKNAKAASRASAAPATTTPANATKTASVTPVVARVQRSVSDIRKVLKGRPGVVSISLLDYFAGKIDEKKLIKVLNQNEYEDGKEPEDKGAINF